MWAVRLERKIHDRWVVKRIFIHEGFKQEYFEGYVLPGQGSTWWACLAADDVQKYPPVLFPSWRSAIRATINTEYYAKYSGVW